MKKLKYINILSFVVIFFVVFSIYPAHSFSFGNSCKKVLTFKISKIDKEFNLSKDDAVTYAKEAANIWNNGLGKKVLEYNEKGKVDITFVYDERQKKAIERNILSEKAKNKSSELEARNQEIKTQKDKFEQLKIDFEKDWNAFSKNMQTYNTSVNEINARGGADQYQFQTLEQEKNILEQKKNELENKKNEINNYMDSLNNNVKNYNNLVNDVNSIVKEINEKIKGTFEQGRYSSNNKITLFEYDNLPSLKRLMAHELGHALRLSHTKNSESLMYYLNQSEKFVLTKEDILEYGRVCGLPR